MLLNFAFIKSGHFVKVETRDKRQQNLYLNLILFYRFPQKPINNYDDEDIDSSYFRRKPTSFLSSSDAKRYTWMPADEDAVRLEGPRPIRPFESNGGPYVVGSSYPPKTSSFLSQSSEQITG